MHVNTVGGASLFATLSRTQARLLRQDDPKPQRADTGNTTATDPDWRPRTVERHAEQQHRDEVRVTIAAALLAAQELGHARAA